MWKKISWSHRPFLGGSRKTQGWSGRKTLVFLSQGAPQLPRDTAGSLLACGSGGGGQGTLERQPPSPPGEDKLPPARVPHVPVTQGKGTLPGKLESIG